MHVTGGKVELNHIRFFDHELRSFSSKPQVHVLFWTESFCQIVFSYLLQRTCEICFIILVYGVLCNPASFFAIHYFVWLFCIFKPFPTKIELSPFFSLAWMAAISNSKWPIYTGTAMHINGTCHNFNYE